MIVVVIGLGLGIWGWLDFGFEARVKQGPCLRSARTPTSFGGGNGCVEKKEKGEEEEESMVPTTHVGGKRRIGQDGHEHNGRVGESRGTFFPSIPHRE